MTRAVTVDVAVNDNVIGEPRANVTHAVPVSAEE